MLIERFIDYLQIEKNYSSNTLSAYKKDLIEFKIFIKENFEKYTIENAEYKVIRLWIVELVNKNLSNRSINRKVSSIKHFYLFFPNSSYDLILEVTIANFILKFGIGVCRL